MNQLNYTTARQTILNAFCETLPNRNDEDVNAQFAMTSASLMNFIPDVPFERHEHIFKSILLYKKLSIAEQSSAHALDMVKTENLEKETLALLQNKPCIICSFHTGSYRIINLFLIKHKIPYSLVMGKEVMEKEGGDFLTLYNEYRETNGAGLTIINAEAAQAGLQMLRELKRGRSLVLYIDGNSGAGDATMKNENHCCINFLNQQLYARKGIAWLAHAANAAIIPVASYRPSQSRIQLRFFDPIHPTGKDRNTFAEQTTQLIYDYAAPIIRENPEQWEGWLYIHKVANIINHKEPVPNEKDYTLGGDVYFNSPAFGIFKINNTPFLLRKNDYSFYEIDDELYNLLTVKNLQPVPKECINPIHLKQLFEQGVVVNVKSKGC